MPSNTDYNTKCLYCGNIDNDKFKMDWANQKIQCLKCYKIVTSKVFLKYNRKKING